MPHLLPFLHRLFRNGKFGTKGMISVIICVIIVVEDKDYDTAELLT